MFMHWHAGVCSVKFLADSFPATFLACENQNSPRHCQSMNLVITYVQVLFPVGSLDVVSVLRVGSMSQSYCASCPRGYKMGSSVGIFSVLLQSSLFCHFIPSFFLGAKRIVFCSFISVEAWILSKHRVVFEFCARSFVSWLKYYFFLFIFLV